MTKLIRKLFDGLPGVMLKIIRHRFDDRNDLAFPLVLPGYGNSID